MTSHCIYILSLYFPLRLWQFVLYALLLFLFDKWFILGLLVAIVLAFAIIIIIIIIIITIIALNILLL